MLFSRKRLKEKVLETTEASRPEEEAARNEPEKSLLEQEGGSSASLGPG